MAEQIDVKSGFVSALKKLLHDKEFIVAFVELLLGQEGATDNLKSMILKRSYQGGRLDEIVMARRLMKAPINEERAEDKPKDKNLLQKVADLPRQSLRFQSKVIAKTLKKPGMVVAAFKLIKSRGKDPTAYAILIPAVVDSIEEVANEEREKQQSPALAENSIKRGTRAEMLESFDPDAKKVSLFIGRFQPFTLGHVKCLQKIRDEFNTPVLICAIPVMEESADKDHPFYGKLQDEMYERLEAGLNAQFNDLIAGCTYVPNGYIGNAVDLAKSLGYQPVGWGCGTDRYEIKTPRKRKKKEGDSDFVVTGYKPQTDSYVAKQRELDPEERNIDPDSFSLLHIQRDVAGEGDDLVSKISGTKVRECIARGDVEGFKSMVPECLYPLFRYFREALKEYYPEAAEAPETAQEPALQTIKEGKGNHKTMKKKITLDDKSLKRIIKKSLNEALNMSSSQESPWVLVYRYIDELSKYKEYALKRAYDEDGTYEVPSEQYDSHARFIHIYATSLAHCIEQIENGRKQAAAPPANPGMGNKF